MTDAVTAPYDCCQCGACCRSPWEGEGYARLYELDLERLQHTGLPIIMMAQPGEGDQMEAFPVLGTKRDGEGFRICVAFAGSVGQACACTIYEDRPEVCRKFEVGSSLCRTARQKAGLPV